jgi:hypothetical protein
VCVEFLNQWLRKSTSTTESAAGDRIWSLTRLVTHWRSEHDVGPREEVVPGAVLAVAKRPEDVAERETTQLSTMRAATRRPQVARIVSRQVGSVDAGPPAAAFTAVRVTGC